MSARPGSLHLIIPMSGQGTRYQRAGFTQPKPLIAVNGTPMIERLLAAFPERWPCHFVLAENHLATELPSLLKRLRPQATIDVVPVHAHGPSFAVRAALAAIPAGDAVLVSYCDYGLAWDSQGFEAFVRSSGCDACLVSYRGFHAHYLTPVPYAYSRLDGERVVEVREKGCFTAERENEFASCGAYYFRTAALLREAIEAQEERGLSLNGEFYTSLTVEALLQARPESDVRVFEIPGFCQWGTPEDLREFESWERAYGAYSKHLGHVGQVAQVLMPMAGKGSRFSAVTPLPKPLIPVHGVPMYQAALASLPRAERTVVVALAEFRDSLEAAPVALHHQVKATSLPTGVHAVSPARRESTQVVYLPETPSGQALSTAAGLEALDLEAEVLISACDHAIAFKPGDWAAFHADPDCDAAIFTYTGYALAAKTPQAFAYVVPGAGDERFPLVETVSVKVPVSSAPERDAVLVGSFWCRSGKILSEGIDLLVAKDLRVNGELYLDSIFMLLKERGLKIRMLPLAGYINWGDPAALAAALYWREMFMGQRLEIRPRFPGVPRHA